MKPRNVVRLLAAIKIKCTALECKEKPATSYAARVHATKTGHTIEETRKYKIGVIAR